VSNLLTDLPPASESETIEELLAAPGVRIERIVSHGHASPDGFWYDQDRAEWVMVLRGSAGLMFEGESAPRTLKAGDHVHIPAHARHRVVWTAPDEPTIWLAVHCR
jgi:cupin 2 domain-containing protein